MQVILLGTGPAESIPRKGHTDALCTDAGKGGKSRRRNAAALVVEKQTRVLIDCGPDILEQIKIGKIDNLNGALLTHGHWDAIGGLGLFSKWAQKNKIIIPVYTDLPTIKILNNKFKQLTNLELIDIQEKTFKVGSIAITRFKVEHSLDKNHPTHGFKFSKFAYISDVSSLSKNVELLLKNFPVLILDAAMYFGRNMPTHLTVEQAINLASKLKIKHLFLTQTGHTYPPHNQAEKEINKYWKSQKLFYPQQVDLAYDGQKINL